MAEARTSLLPRLEPTLPTRFYLDPDHHRRELDAFWYRNRGAWNRRDRTPPSHWIVAPRRRFGVAAHPRHPQRLREHVRRVRCERELIASYLDALRARGVAGAPDLESAWKLHRQTAIWGFLVGWMTCPTENYGELVLRANLDRITTALEDLETLPLLAG